MNDPSQSEQVLKLDGLGRVVFAQTICTSELCFPAIREGVLIIASLHQTMNTDYFHISPGRMPGMQASPPPGWFVDIHKKFSVLRDFHA